MSGIEKIIETVLADAEHACENVMNDAKNKEQSIIDAAKEEAKRKSDDILKLAENEAAGILRKTESDMDLHHAKRLLAERVAIIEEVTGKALERLLSLPDKEYFENLISMAAANAEKGKGVMLLSKKDFARMDTDFNTRLNKILSEKGKALTVEESDRILDGGFILRYGNVEHNCTFSALFSAFSDELKDIIYAKLFD